MPSKLRENQIIAAGLLATGAKNVDVANKLGVTPETVSRWRRQDDFVALVNVVQGDAHDDARNLMRSLVQDALSVVQGQLVDTDLPPKARLDAAQTVLRYVALDAPSTEVIGPVCGRRIGEINEMKKVGLDYKLCNPG